MHCDENGLTDSEFRIITKDSEKWKPKFSLNDSYRATRKNTITMNAIKFADDLNELSRMPITALRITSEAEAANLQRKTILFMVLDLLIICNTVLFLILSPIEKNKYINSTMCDKNGDHSAD